MRVYYKCTLYEDIDGDSVPVDKARLITNKLDNIGIATFEIVIPQDPVPEPQEEEQYREQ